jgi:hypothetical protein
MKRKKNMKRAAIELKATIRVVGRVAMVPPQMMFTCRRN